MKSRFLNNWATTLIGLLIFAFAGLLIYNEKIDSETFGALLLLAGTYLRARDSLIGLEAK